jgi:salicylate hydroxylase
MQGKDQTVVVVGGGVGGVATALAMGSQGYTVKLLEQADQIGAIGYGVQIGSNVLPMLDRLGVGDEARKIAYLPDEIKLHDAFSGTLLSHIPLQTDEFKARYAQPYAAVHRVDLHNVLLAGCRKFANVNLNQATTVTGFSQDAHGVRAQTAAGAEVPGEVLIAADGLRSRIRAQMHPDDAWRDTGYAAHRTLIAMSDAPGPLRGVTGVTMWTGPGFHVIYYPLRDRTELNMVAVFRGPRSGEPQADDYAAFIRNKTAPCQPEVRAVVELMTMDRKWSIADRNPIRQWSQGRVCLLGDAAHATLQSLAQGAGMALEDVACLAQLLELNGGDFQRAFRDFQSARFLRTARVQLESRSLWEVFHGDGVEVEVAWEQLKERTPQDYYRCLDWLWNPPAYGGCAK